MKKLNTIDADTLLSTSLPPTRFIIDRLLPQGLHILAGAPMRCPRHGFTSTRKCLVAQVSTEFCDEEVQNFEEVSMYDPAPTLFIQDELHLMPW